MTRPRASRTFENVARRLGYVHVAGVDEVGRGCLAGPVVAGAVILHADRYVPGVADSKVLTAEDRQRLFGQIVDAAVCWHVAVVEAAARVVGRCMRMSAWNRMMSPETSDWTATSADVPVIVTRASNNYGPYQFPEKIIPLFVTNAMDDLPVPLYGDGGNVRDWLHVLDHCRALDMLIHTAQNGEVYNIGGGNEVKNVDLTHQILKHAGKTTALIKPVADRKGHDRRYSLDAGKLARLGFSSATPFEQGLAETVRWYAEHEDWWRPIKEKDAAYREYYRAQYGDRLATSSATAKPPG